MTEDFIKIGNKKVGPGAPPFIVAEMSGNHNQSLERALAIVDAAAKTGVHALKLQTYTADSLTANLNTKDFVIRDPASLWEGQSLYQLYQQAATPWEWHKPIMERCHKLGLICFSTPFDDKAVDFLEDLNMPCYKIASFENIHLPLIRKVAATGKPLIISTGLANAAELDETVKVARDAGCKDLILLKCTSSYPSTPENSNIRTIPHMRDLFQCQVGLSDHTPGIGVSVASVSLGATFIEKHFTLSRADGGVDSAFSMEPAEMQALVIETERAWQAQGKVTYGVSEAEKSSMTFRRSIYVVKDVKAGETLTQDNMRIIRPGHGLAPKYFDLLLGKKVRLEIKAGTPASWDLIG